MANETDVLRQVIALTVPESHRIPLFAALDNVGPRSAKDPTLANDNGDRVQYDKSSGHHLVLDDDDNVIDASTDVAIGDAPAQAATMDPKLARLLAMDPETVSKLLSLADLVEKNERGQELLDRTPAPESERIPDSPAPPDPDASPAPPAQPSPPPAPPQQPTAGGGDTGPGGGERQ